jgi:hypothetical protein
MKLLYSKENFLWTWFYTHITFIYILQKGVFILLPHNKHAQELFKFMSYSPTVPPLGSLRLVRYTSRRSNKWLVVSRHVKLPAPRPALLNKVDQLGLLTKIFFIYSYGEAATYSIIFMFLFLCFLILATGDW